MNTANSLKTGGDPRALPDYAALRDELAKLSHPARPDVDWLRIEQLSLSLFQQNGVELQTLSWYTLARARLGGMAGLNEGLVLLETLLIYHWATMWPRPVHARMEILAGLSQRLQSLLRTLTLDYPQLPLIYQAEQHLNRIHHHLQRLELKNASQLGELITFMHNTATRLEKSETGHSDYPEPIEPVTAVAAELPETATSPEPVATAEKAPAVVHEVPEVVSPPPEAKARRPWRAFVAGMLTMLLAGAAATVCWQKISPAPLSPVPVNADESALTALAQLSPLWRQEYGFTLAARAAPGESAKLKAQWQRYLSENALPAESLSGWHQGMEGLQELTRRLNALDERKGKYLTGSELKSMVFTITQNFSRNVPVEEQLYQLGQTGNRTSGSAAKLMQTDMQFDQLLNRYALIKQQAEQQ
ncbi:VasL domain-containing protein [Pantoea sp. C2G6]|uniref:VasL domain-containing protein n=1 Tax=Pantoea sp. C2G6 TaxID=3243084 RepID=UPI003ED87ED2